MSLRTALLVAVLGLAALAAAGCVSPAPTTTASVPDAAAASADWPSVALPFGEGHDHRKFEDHANLSTPNFQLLAHDPLSSEYYDGKTAGGYFCGGTAARGEQRLAITGSFDTEILFVVVDVTDPNAPVKLGEYILNSVQDYDVDVTPDGRFVVIAADPSTGESGPQAVAGLALPLARTITVQPKFRDACTGIVRDVGPEQQIPYGPATLLVSIEDPKAPQLVDYFPAPVLGPHSVSTSLVGGKTFVASSITNLAHQASYFQFFELVDAPTGGKLVPLSTVTSGQYGSVGPMLNGHVEAEIAEHPVTKQMIAYLSDWDGGLVILDLSIPEAPVRLSQWADDGVEGGAVHSTRSVEGLWNGRHYVVVGQEFTHRPEDRPSGWIYIIDDTDPTQPKEVARWTLPVDVDGKWGGAELFSTHYFRLVNQTLFVTMYHGGVWAVDLSNPEAPRSIGAFVPSIAPPAGRTPDGFYDYKNE